MNPPAAALTRIAVDVNCDEFGVLTELILAFPAGHPSPGLSYVIAEPGTRSWLIPGDVVTCTPDEDTPRLVQVDSYANGFLASHTVEPDSMLWHGDEHSLAQRWEALDGLVTVEDDRTVTGYWPGPIAGHFSSNLWEVTRKAPGFPRLFPLHRRVHAVERRLVPAPFVTTAPAPCPDAFSTGPDTSRWLRKIGVALERSTYQATGNFWTAIEKHRSRGVLDREDSLSIPPIF